MTKNTTLNIVCDESIPFGPEAFSQFGSVITFPGREITPDLLKSTDVLIVRSITKVDEELLKNTPVKFVGTATIGTDHIDTDYIKRSGIHFASAAGCNSNSVKEYVLTAIFELSVKYNFIIEGMVIGIFGAGNIGSKVRSAAEALGMKVLVSDPPLYRKTGDRKYNSLRSLSECDVVTLHVPLTFDGEDKTFRLIDEEKIRSLKENAILINTSRGGVVDERGLLKACAKKNIRKVFDVWENEPDFNTGFADVCDIATPHIAGYSYEGKVNGTRMIYNSLCDYLGAARSWTASLLPVNNPVIVTANDVSDEKFFYQITSSAYNIMKDDERFREGARSANPGKEFDLIRKNYPVRREFSNYRVRTGGQNKNLLQKVEKTGFLLSLESDGDN